MKHSLSDLLKPNTLKRILPIAVLALFLVVCFIANPRKPVEPTPGPGPSTIIDDEVPLASLTDAYFMVAHPGVSFDDISGLTEDMFDYVGSGTVFYTKDIIANPSEVEKAIAQGPDISSFEAERKTIEWRYIIRHENSTFVAGVYTDYGASYFEAEYYLFNPQDSVALFTNITPELAEFVGDGLFYYAGDTYNQVDSVWSSVAREPEYNAPSGKYIEWSSAYAFQGRFIVVGRYVDGIKPEFPNELKDSSGSSIAYDDIGDFNDEIVVEECKHNWTYKSNNDGTHLKICSICDEIIDERCELDDNGICTLCGFKKAQNEFANISELKNANVKSGDRVSTLGYHSKNDGGGTTYIIARSTRLTPDDGVCIKLSNGLYAVIEDTSQISAKYYGLKGDGSAEDISRLQAILNSNCNNIFFPAGTYQFSGNIITLNNMVSFIGEGKNKTKINNLGLDIKNGVELDNICFDGGADFVISGAGGIKYNLKGIVTMHPKNTSSEVIYKNCSFQNVGFVSSVTSTGRLKRDYVYGCDFQNIGRIAIHHSINIDESVYENNHFKNIGSTSIYAGPVSGIWLGDLTNNTYVECNQATIKNNTFEDLYTADDPVGANHNINANFLAVRAVNATITDNTISRVHGCGADREGLYTKVSHLTISNNTLTDAGYGEGFITCKGHDGPDSYATITGNTINGSHGSGIYLYGPGTIQNNTISLSNCRAAIVCFCRSKETNDELTIDGNTITCHPDHFYFNGAVVQSFDPSSLIRIENVNIPIYFRNNVINATGEAGIIRYGVKIFNLKNNLTVTGNTINCNVERCGSLAVTGSADISSQNKDVRVEITKNNLSSTDIAISVMLKVSSGVVTNREYTVHDNIVNGVTQSKYGTLIDGGDGNQDTLDFKSDSTITSNFSKCYANIGEVTNSANQVTLKKK